jgi:hypothetical protein
MTFLSSLEDFREILTRKTLLTRIRLARRYVKRAYVELHHIRVSCHMMFGWGSCLTYQSCRAWILLCRPLTSVDDVVCDFFGCTVDTRKKRNRVGGEMDLFQLVDDPVYPSLG